MKVISIQFLVKRFCSLLLLLQMINMSVDPVRHLNIINGEATYQENLNINKPESIYELILENLFNQDVPESQDIKEDALDEAMFIYYSATESLLANIGYGVDVRHNHSYINHYSRYHPQLDSPPPKS